MRAFNRWLALHPWVQGVLTGVVGAGVTLLMDPGSSLPGTLLRVGVGALGATGTLRLVRRKERRVSGAASERDYVALDDRLRHGEVPESAAERAAMGKLVRQRLHTMRHRHWAVAFLYLMFGSIAVAVAVTGGVRQIVVYSLLTVTFLAWMTWNSIHQHRILVRMAGQLEPASR